MKYEDNLEFLNLLHRSMTLAIDEPPSVKITVNDFFDRLYIPFPPEDEDAVNRAIQDANSFVVVVGPPGGGKTTILRHALHSKLTKKVGLFYFDFKKQYEKFYRMGGDPPNKLFYLQNIFKKELADQYLSGDLDIKLQWMYTALCMFYEQERIQKLIFRWRTINHKADAGKEEKDRKELFMRDLEIHERENDYLKENMTCGQMILSIKRTFNFDKFLVVFDNIDRIPVFAKKPVDDQRILFSIAIDIYSGGEGGFGTIVAVRNKNIMRFEPQGQDGNIIEIVSILSQTNVTSRPVRMHSPSSDFVSKLFEARHSFVGELISDGIDKNTFKDERELFSLIRPHVNTKFIEERFYNLANHSYREMLVMNLEFIKYIFRLISKNIEQRDERWIKLIIKRVSYKAHMSSYLYRWMYTVNNPDHAFLLDTVSQYDKYMNGAEKVPLNCDIIIVILAWLTNHSRRFLRVDEIVKGFNNIGVDSLKVLQSIYSLYDVNKVTHRYIEIGDTEDEYSLRQLTNDNPRITLMPLGREFVETTITKFEFLHQCLAYPDTKDVDSPEMMKLLDIDIDNKIEIVFEFLKKMKTVHSASLLDIKHCSSIPFSKGEKYSWEEYYRYNFCVNRDLILERTIASHLLHLKKTYTSAFKKWKSSYVDLLEEYYKSFGSSRNAEGYLKGRDL